MLPLRDDVRSSTVPFVTIGLVLANTLVFLYELMLGPQLDVALLQYSVIPARYTMPDVARLFSLPEQVMSFFTSMFLHGGWLHLIGNMWILWIFGDNVEDRLGHARFLALYLASGLAASIVHILSNAESVLPTIGASGAIAGVMGAYFRFFPTARVETIIPPFFLGPIFVLPAVVFLGFWFLMQFFSGALSLGTGPHAFSGIAWWAHVGGFGFGLVVCLFAPRIPPVHRTYRAVS